MLTGEEAVAAALEALARHVEPGEEYAPSRVEWSEEDRSWWVHLLSAVPRPGGLVTVVVDGLSGDCRVLPGK